MSNQDNNKYTIGWVCALTTELVAAQAFLDEKHEGPEYVSPNDENSYTLGKFGKHNVVIAVLPDGEYGLASAASVARDMLHSFPNIRLGLMVGIGGGAPSTKNDIRLGDIVVSCPCEGNSGVFQYDFGKTIQDQRFQTTGFLNKPPRVLLAAVNKLKADYELENHEFESTINNIIKKKPKLRKNYMRPSQNTDRLYQSRVIHPLNYELNCAVTCGDNLSTLISRPERTKEEDNPAIHYGLIASANQLMKDALVRDKLIAEKNILCFEMEAAGLMNNFPCLVIRGICDYSDSHKKKEWQGYAAMAAAVYAKDLLSRIPPNRVESERTIGEVLSDLQYVAEAHRDIARKQLEVQQDAFEAQQDDIKQRLSDKQQECLQLFRLTKSTEDATYEWFKDRIEDRVQDTCIWFLKHNHFQKWLKQKSGPLLISADPGCGKSVLAKYLIDYELLSQSATTCYFFFKDHDQNTVRQALCALLHQLFSQKPLLIQHAIKQFDKDGQGLINSTRSLWKILENAVQDPQAGSVIIVLDALDECAETEFIDIIRNVENQFRCGQRGHSRLKYLLTSRPYELIMSKFRGLLDDFPRIHIPGEEESDKISQEINHVIKHRIKRLAREKKLSDRVQDHLTNQLLRITHRTYLWVHLVFDYLITETFKKTPKGVDAVIATLPKSISQAYEQILNKSKEHGMVRKTLSIILGAGRPLTLSEMNVALNIDGSIQAIHSLDLEDEPDFKSRLRSWCGLFISIHHGKIYFLHQTAREFLLADQDSSTSIHTELQWHHSITIQYASTVLAEVCLYYLNLFNSDPSIWINIAVDSSHHIDSHAFLDYSARFWSLHFREACVREDNDTIAPFALGICDPDSKAYLMWSQIYWKTVGHVINRRVFTCLTVASYFGHSSVAKLLFDKGIDLELNEKKDGQIALWWAARNGHEAVVKLLLERGADLELKDKNGQTPLWWAVQNGHKAVVKLLLERGADIESKDKENAQTPLLCAAGNGDEAVVKLLLERGANLDSKDNDGKTPLSWAAKNSNEAVIKLLLKGGADLDSKDENGQTPLGQAAKNGHEAVVKLLLERGANLDLKDKNGRTSLWWAVYKSHRAVVKLLLERGANLEPKDKIYGRTPLSCAAGNGDEAVIKLLLERGANLESEEHFDRDADWKSEEGLDEDADRESEADSDVDLEPDDLDEDADQELEEHLDRDSDWESEEDLDEDAHQESEVDSDADLESDNLDGDADLESEHSYNQAPLIWAAQNGYEPSVKLLLERGANLESKDRNGQTVVSWAARNGHEAVVKLLFERGANLDSKDKDGKTPLSWAASNNYKAVIKLLLESGADLESKDEYNRTPLSWALSRGNEAVVKLLLKRGCNLDSEDQYGQTPLWWAVRNRHKAVIKLLVKRGADLESADKYGQTPLSWAAKNGEKAVIKLLIGEGANIESEDFYGQTPLLLASWHGHEAVVKLLQKSIPRR